MNARDREKTIAAWLSKRPAKTLEWLQAMMGIGFDLHHLDGDRTNDDPDNIVLIEHQDHMDIHGLSMNSAPLRKLPTNGKRQPTPEELDREEFAYSQAAHLGRDSNDGVWPVVAVIVGSRFKDDFKIADVQRMARRWASRRSLPWPLVRVA